MLMIPIARPFNTLTLNFPDRAIFVKTAKFWVGHRVGHGLAQVLYTPCRKLEFQLGNYHDCIIIKI